MNERTKEQKRKREERKGRKKDKTLLILFHLNSERKLTQVQF